MGGVSGTALVVGAGITGVSAAEWLRRDGWTVTLIDRVAPGDPAQTSYGNAGLIARGSIVPVATPGLALKAPKMLLDPMSPLFLRWSYLPRLLPWLVPFLRNGRKERMLEIVRALADIATDSVDRHLALARGTAAEAFIRTGRYVYAYPDRAAYEADLTGHALRREYGMDHEVLTGDALRAFDPALSPGLGVGAVYEDHGWIDSPGGYVAALAEHFARNGGAVERAEVVDIAPTEGGAAVTLAGGRRIEADKVALAAGVWSRRFAERLGHACPMIAERGHHVMYREPSAQPPCPIMISSGKFLLTPMRDGLRAAGTTEFAPIDAPENPAALAMLRAQVKRAYPGLTAAAEETWMGRRPTTVDSLPMIGAAPNAPHVLFAFGAQHIGLTLGPRIGRLTADIAAGRRPNVDLSPFRPDRFDR